MAWKDRLYKRARRQGWAVFPAYARAVADVPMVLATAEPADLVGAPAGAVRRAPLPQAHLVTDHVVA